MPYIKVDIHKLTQYLQTMDQVRAITGSAAGEFSAAADSIDPSVRQLSGIDGQLRSIAQALSHHQQVQTNMSGFLDFAQQKYRLLGGSDAVGDAASGAGAVVFRSAGELQSQDPAAQPRAAAVKAAAVAVGVAAGTAAERLDTAVTKAASVTAGAAAGTAAERLDTAVTKAASVAVGVAAGTAAEKPDTAVTKAASVTAGAAAGTLAAQLNAAAATAASVAAAVSAGTMDEAEVLRTAAANLNVKVEDLLQGMEDKVYTLKDITECLEGKATDANKFIQNAADFLKKQTGTSDIVFENRDGYWILSGYQRDSKANDLVKTFHDGTGIGSRYKEDTLKDTPVLGTVFQADQLAKKAEDIAQKVQNTADAIDKAADTALLILDTADTVRQRGKEAADKIADILADESTTQEEKLAASKAIVDTTVVSTTLQVAAAPVSQGVTSVISKYVGEASGDKTLGKKVGEVSGKLVEGGMNIVSTVVASDKVVDQVTQSNLAMNDALDTGAKAVGEAGRKLLESESVGEALVNVGGLMVAAGSAGSNIVKTTFTEGAKVAYTVTKETVITVADQVGDAVVAGCQTVYNKVKTEYETVKGFGEEVVGGLGTVAVLAGEAKSIMASSDKDIGFSEAVALAAQELGISKADIHDSIDKGLCTTQDIFEYLDGKATEANSFVKNVASTLRTVSGATDMVFKNKDGYIIVSEFTRKGWANTLVKTFNDGTGIGTRYKPETLKDTPVIGTLYKADEAVKVMDKVVEVADAVVTGVTGIVETGQKINAIWEDETLSKKEKIYDTAAVAITGVVGTALDVAAPFAGAAVKTAVVGAVSTLLPGVGPVVGQAIGAVAGAIVEGGIELVADVITSEAVVNQVSDSMMKVGDTVAAECKAVSDAGKKLLESENAKEALQNTAEFVGTAVASGAKVVATAVTEGAKVAVTVATETAKAVGEAVVAKAKAVGETAKKVAEGAKKAAEAVGDAVVAGAKVVSDAAKEAAEKAKKAAEAAAAEVRRKAEEAARKAEEAVKKAAEEAKRKAEEIARQVAEAKRKAEEAARKAAEEAKRKAEEIARKAAEAKRKAEEAARKAAAEAKRKAEEAARKAAEAAKKAAAEAKRKAEEAAKKAAAAAKKAAEAAKKKAAEAAKKAKKALSKW